MYILLNNISGTVSSSENKLLFWLVAVNTFTFLHDMRLILLNRIGKMLNKWLSEQFWQCFSCIYVLI